jgi:hypothetical protein
VLLARNLTALDMLFGGNFLPKIPDDGTRVFAAPLGRPKPLLKTFVDAAAKAAAHGSRY